MDDETPDFATETLARLKREGEELDVELANPEITALRADNQRKKAQIAEREAGEVKAAEVPINALHNDEVPINALHNDEVPLPA